MSEIAAPARVALVGNPNSGKTALFNALTRSRQKVANYPESRSNARKVWR
jgi:ferrous iron transport protein B